MLPHAFVKEGGTEERREGHWAFLGSTAVSEFLAFIAIRASHHEALPPSLPNRFDAG